MCTCAGRGSEHLAVTTQRAGAWLRRLDTFVTGLMTDLSQLYNPSAPHAQGPASALAAQLLLEAHSKLAAVEDMCNVAQGRSSRDSGNFVSSAPDLWAPMHERLILSDVQRDASGDMLEHIAAVKHVVQRLVPVSRLPYQRYFARRISM